MRLLIAKYRVIMKIHEQLRTAREQKHWSQEQVAEQLGMSVNGYAKIERGETKTYNPKLQRLVTILGLNLIDLFNSEDESLMNLVKSQTPPEHQDTAFEMSREYEQMAITINHQKELLLAKALQIDQLQKIINLLEL
jgi:transcriptional regulator with XRE-family HTH domain